MSKVAKTLKQELNPRGEGMRLTPAFRARVEGNLRLKLQPPEGKDRGDFNRRISGLPGDVLLALESIRALAEQGNDVAKHLYESETKRLGLWYEVKHFYLPKRSN
jgi:hypothetical protein